MAAPAESSTHWSKQPLTLRIISAAVLIPIVVAAVYAGHPAWTLLVILFGGVMAWEWSKIASRSDLVTRAQGHFAVTVTVLFTVGFLAALSFPTVWPRVLHDNVGYLWLAAAVVFLAAIRPFDGVIFRRHRPWPQFGSLWFLVGIFYVNVPCIAIIALRADPQVGLQQIFWIVALVIAADTGAYIAGRSIGGPKLAPRISPNKTWAGLGGAVVSAAVVGVITAVLMDHPSALTLTVVSGFLGIVAQAGDLAESAFKRHFGVKDASNIIPGHGGALDRVDGLIAVAAAVAGINTLIGSSVLTWL
jgi:phosphatidate cytidylyltransferase